MRRDLDMARQAFEAVERLVADEPGAARAIRTRLRTLPAMIQQSGLVAAMAFIAARAQTNKPIAAAYKMTYDTLNQRIEGRFGHRDLLQWLNTGGFGEHEHAIVEAEVREYVAWLRRAAEALIPAEE